MKKITFGLGATALLFGACAEGPKTTTDDFGYEGTGIEVSIAPLTLDSLSDACYSFAIKNAANQLVVGRGPGAASVHNTPAVGETPAVNLVTGTAAQTVCASQFGNGVGGDISYVAPCDADSPSHTVTLWVDALCTSGAPVKTGIPNWRNSPTAPQSICTEMQAYVNPCGSIGCNLTVACAENQDTPVTFNFTIMGQADQGFFDIAVNFDDVFCSAKMDTCGTDNAPIRLVFDPATNERMNTLVLAVACTRGPGVVTDADATHLTFAPLSVTCGSAGGIIPLAGVTAEGKQTVFNNLNWSAYFGTESLSGVNKVYTNLAFGIPTGATCAVNWEVAPSSGEFVEASGGNSYSSYGYVDFTATGIKNPVTLPGDCTRLPMNGAPGTAVLNGGDPGTMGVKTDYEVRNSGVGGNPSATFGGNAQIGQGDSRLSVWPTPVTPSCTNPCDSLVMSPNGAGATFGGNANAYCASLNGGATPTCSFTSGTFCCAPGE